MNQLVAAAAQRQLVELERRVAQQWHLIEQLIGTNRDASQATRTLRVLQQTLELTREHLRILAPVDRREIALEEATAERSPAL